MLNKGPLVKNIGSLSDKSLKLWLIKQLRYILALNEKSKKAARDIDEVYLSYSEIAEIKCPILRKYGYFFSVLHDYGINSKWSPKDNEIAEVLRELLEK